ncbi:MULTISPECIES: NAD(P)H-dependent oxidoreductase [Cysteiniphilum]|uniref:NAD(P)H-dependent oxidoreductase n=1 Tax=Cysteiniphilum TaxID=2056696 RepID=UPI00178280F9|nr:MULTISPECIES: NAD(P)H-dependent oxidoreductase [Cysteiniphilum]
MNYIELLEQRFACKKFDSTRKISAKDKAFILEAGRLSPSSFGLEPWQFVVIQDDKLREKLKPACWSQSQITDSSFVVIILSRKAHNFRGKSDYVRQKVSRRNLPQEMQDTYLGLVQNYLSVEDTDAWAKRQCYIALTNLLNAAQSLGISSCPIEGFEAENVKKVLDEYKQINFDDFDFSGVMCAFGYSAMDLPKKFRAASTEVIIEI